MDVTTINMQSKNINVLLSKLQFRLASNVEKNEYYSYNDIQYAIMYLVIICINIIKLLSKKKLLLFFS